MSIQINISGTIIEFPSSAQSPNWAPALIEFAQTVESALSGLSGPGSISPQVVDILNNGIETPLPASFSTSQIRSANIRYSVYRSNSVNPLTETHAETGYLNIVYNSQAGTWELQRDFIGNKTPIGGPGATTSGITFRIDNSGQLYYTAATINTTNYIGKLSIAAQALSQT